MLTCCTLTSAGDEMPSSVWLSHDKQKKLHSFLEHLFSQVSQKYLFRRDEQPKKTIFCFNHIWTFEAVFIPNDPLNTQYPSEINFTFCFWWCNQSLVQIQDDQDIFLYKLEKVFYLQSVQYLLRLFFFSWTFYSALHINIYTSQFLKRCHNLKGIFNELADV